MHQRDDRLRCCGIFFLLRDAVECCYAVAVRPVEVQRAYRASRAVGQRLFPALLLGAVTSGLDETSKIRRAEVFDFVDGSSIDEVHFGVVVFEKADSFVVQPLLSTGAKN